jgi:hypothetical protein
METGAWEIIATGVPGGSEFIDNDPGRTSQPDGYYRGVQR